MKFLISVSIIFYLTNSYSQCCCANFKVNFIDEEGMPIDNSTGLYTFKVKIWYSSTVIGKKMKNIDLQDRTASGTSTNGSIAEKGIVVPTGCGLKKTMILVRTKGIRMKLVIKNVYADYPFEFKDVQLKSGRFQYEFEDLVKGNS